MKTPVLLAIWMISRPALSFTQEPVSPADLRPSVTRSPEAGTKFGANAPKPNSPPNAQPGSSTLSLDYAVGPGDLLTLSEVDLEESQAFNEKSFRVDNSGDVTLPLAGRLHVAGLTTVAVEGQINERLRGILKNPQTVVEVAEFHSQPVSVLGAVNSPGIVQIAGGKSLFEVLSLAGGLREDAGNTIKITRDMRSGKILLPDVKPDSTGQFSIASVRVKSIMRATDPVQNILIMPGDTITVPKGEVVYIVGDVVRPGGFLLGENGTLSALQVISLAEGLLKTSSPARAEILREKPGVSGREQIPVNVKEVLAGKSPDVPLQPEDILFIPNSRAKTAGYRTVDAIVNMAGGAAIVATRF